MIRSFYKESLRRKARASKWNRRDTRLDETVRAEQAGKSGVATVLIVKEIYIEAPLETVLEFLTDDAKIERWLDVGSLLHRMADEKLRIRLRGKKVEWACMEIRLSEDLGLKPAAKKLFLRESIWTRPSVIEVDLRTEGAGTRLNLMHRHLDS